MALHDADDLCEWQLKGHQQALTDTPSGNRSVEEPIWGTNSSPRCVRALMYSPQNIKVYTLVTWAELSGVNTNKSLLKIMHV